MKVVIAHNQYVSTQPSGENTIVDIEIEQLAAAGVEVVPFLRSSDEIAWMRAAGKAKLALSPIYNRRSNQVLAQVLRDERPDVLHLHNPYPLLSPWVVRTAHQHGVPVIQTVHNYRQVCSSGLYFRDGHVCHDCRGRRFGFPAIQYACYRGSRAQSVIMASALAVHRGTWLAVDRYIALTSAIEEHLLGYGISPERISVKPNAVVDPGPPPPDPGDGFLFAARLTQEKGLALLLAAWQRHPVGALGPLRIAGDGPERGLAETAAAQRADVEYLGQRDRAAVAAAIRAASCVVATPTWHDVLPTIALEAFANGRPVLATRMGGLPYLVGVDGAPSAAPVTVGVDGAPSADPVTVGPAGWVVEPTVDAVASGLAAAHAGASAAGSAARQRYERQFTPEVITQRLIGIYAEVAGTMRETP